MANDSAPFLLSSRQITRNVRDGQERDVEGVTATDEPRRFVRRIAIQTARHYLRLVGDDADRLAVDSGQTGNQVFGEIRLVFED